MEVARIKDFSLRNLEEKDLDLVLNWRNSPEIRGVSQSDHIISQEEHRDWFERHRRGKTSKLFLFEVKGRPSGCVNFTDWDSQSLRARWGFYLAPQELQKGLGLAMGYLALETIFEKLKLQKVTAEVLATNQRGLSYHRKLGFFEEGLLKKQILRGSDFVDVHLMAHFKDHWEKKRAQLASSL